MHLTEVLPMEDIPLELDHLHLVAHHNLHSVAHHNPHLGNPSANRLVDLQGHLHLQEDPKEVSHQTLGIHHILTNIPILISFNNP